MLIWLSWLPTCCYKISSTVLTLCLKAPVTTVWFQDVWLLSVGPQASPQTRRVRSDCGMGRPAAAVWDKGRPWGLDQNRCRSTAWVAIFFPFYFLALTICLIQLLAFLLCLCLSSNPHFSLFLPHSHLTMSPSPPLSSSLFLPPSLSLSFSLSLSLSLSKAPAASFPLSRDLIVCLSCGQNIL